MDKIYVVIWESLDETGFQYDLVDAFYSKKDARICCQSLFLDFVKACDNAEAFDNYSVSYEDYGIIVKSDDNPEFYHKFIIEESNCYGSNR